MTTRAQRKRKAVQKEKDTELSALAKSKADKLGVSPEFLGEAIDSEGLVSISFNNRGRQGFTSVHAAKVALSDVAGLRGDSIVNNWFVPKVEAFDITEDGSVSNIDTDVRGIDVSETWIRTADQIQDGYEDDIVLSRQGFESLIQNMGNTALASSLRTIDEQVFGMPKDK